MKNRGQPAPWGRGGISPRVHPPAPQGTVYARGAHRYLLTKAWVLVNVSEHRALSTCFVLCGTGKDNWESSSVPLFSPRPSPPLAFAVFG